MLSQLSYDVVIIGAGPVGLAFACALADQNLKIVILEKEPEAALAEPVADGREIALTYKSIETLKHLGAWQYIVADDISPIKRARVLNACSAYALKFDAADAHQDALGYLVSNFKIRRALYKAFKAHPQITLISGVLVTQLLSADRVVLSDNTELNAKLVVAADSRFSKTRQMMGISAAMHDFGRTMMVCEMAHELPHHHVAQECFFNNITLATLPMNGLRSSVVITLPSSMTEQMLAMNAEQFSSDIEKKLNYNLGKMTLTTKPSGYPLVGVYANHFCADRFALIGDAAVGMHPITAHGFNFGLRSVELLSSKIKTALVQGHAFNSSRVLEQYHRAHWFATRPLYLATNAIAKLYASEKFPMTVLRSAGLRVAQGLKPFRKLLVHKLTQTG